MKDSNKPLVTIHCITFNHESYIDQALQSFLMQEVDFAIEIIVHDDASTDKTALIAQEYANKYPKVFKLLLEKDNQFSKGSIKFVKEMFEMSNGKYITLCEGDDFWTDPTKLQRQVKFMEKHPDYALCFHPVRVFFENSDKEDSIFPDTKSGFTVKQLLQGNYIQSNSVMYRARDDYGSLATNIMPNDWYLHLFHAQFGKIGFINRVMSAYRRHEGGIWWESSNDVSQIWQKYGLKHIELFVELYKIYGDKPGYIKKTGKSIYTAFHGIMLADKQYGGNLTKKVASKYPIATEAFIQYAIQKIDKIEKDLLHNKEKLSDIQQQLASRKYEFAQLNHEIELIRASRMWKLRNKLARVIGKPEA